MSIFQNFWTLRWAILAKSVPDIPMALLSNRSLLEKAISLPVAGLGPIAVPLGCLDRAAYGSEV
ncbi:hypothetical protein [Erythrobacter longus]|uniref:hypothetical protein n=1 Tax=Erythrobacter longus TaxID=1044 RepID=UPI0013779AA3|nr:hypothetical protein [Erythrobacter longus]